MGAARMIPSRYPVVGLLDRVASPEDLPALFELESWTNDRISNELGILHTLSSHEWVTGRPMASVIMAAYCHPSPDGGRFNSPARGAWYAGRTLETAVAESVFRRTQELREVHAFETRVQMRVYLADFRAFFHDIRESPKSWAVLYDPDSYTASQAFAQGLLESRSNGIVYRSVRHPGGECVACFRPALVQNVRVGGHYEFRWEGRPEPIIKRTQNLLP
jgi:RES domain-containing protein